MPTIREVAENAGVSVATVSRVINKSGYVSIDLQERVLDAMKRLHYHPSALARSLRRQETQTVGLLVPQLDSPFFAALAFAIEKTLFSYQYRTFMCSSEEDAVKEDDYITMLLRQRVDGVILVPTGQSALNVFRLAEQGIPVVLVDRDVSGVEITRVVSDNFQGGYNAASHLIALGHRAVGLVGGPGTTATMAARKTGAQRAFADACLSDTPDFVRPLVPQPFRFGYEAGLELLQQTPRPTAIFALTDMIAVGVMHAAAELGLHLPDDLSIVGYDDIPLSAYIMPELTTVSQSIYALGEVAAQLLLDLVRHEQHEPQAVILPTELIVRKSTAAPPQR